jgi:hypothetical protein
MTVESKLRILINFINTNVHKLILDTTRRVVRTLEIFLLY